MYSLRGPEGATSVIGGNIVNGEGGILMGNGSFQGEYQGGVGDLKRSINGKWRVSRRVTIGMEDFKLGMGFKTSNNGNGRF